MKERFNFSLSPLWILISVAALTLPVFLPSSVNPQHFFQDIIGTVTAAMYILSFPFGLLALPLMFLAKLVLGINPQTIGGMYINIFLLCVLGYAQWFWLVPRLWRSEKRFEMLNLFGGKSYLKLSEAAAIDNPEFCDEQGRTPLERVFREKESENKLS